MNFKNIGITIFVLIVFSLFFTKIVSANVYINEVKLLPAEERFIELYNSGSSSVDLTNYYIQRKTATSSTFGSLVSKTYFEGKSIGPNSYFVISKNTINNSDLIFPNLTLTESNTIQLKGKDQEVVSVASWGGIDGSLVSNPVSGKSIQRAGNNEWFISSPTSGENNLDLSQYYDEENDSPSNVVDSNEDNKKEKTLDILKITTKINFPKIITAGVPFSFYSTTTDNRKSTYNVGKFVWNFGDGASITFNSYGPFDYVYEYPGDYVVNLSYFDNNFTEIPDANDRINIKVVPVDIYISSVGNQTDPYVEIENKSKYDIDLSSWTIATNSKAFSFPNGTIIQKGAKIKIHSKVTNFTKDDLKYLIIENKRGDIVSVYPKKVDRNSPYPSKSNKLIDDNNNVIDLNKLEANTLKSNDVVSKSPYFLLSIIIILGITSFILIRKRKSHFNNIDDIDGEIDADNFKILE